MTSMVIWWSDCHFLSFHLLSQVLKIDRWEVFANPLLFSPQPFLHLANWTCPSDTSSNVISSGKSCITPPSESVHLVTVQYGFLCFLSVPWITVYYIYMCVYMYIIHTYTGFIIMCLSSCVINVCHLHWNMIYSPAQSAIAGIGSVLDEYLLNEWLDK